MNRAALNSTYVPLWCKSNYSFLEGASHPQELVEAAHTYGLPAIALTDRNGLYGIVRAHVQARTLGVRLLIGAQLTFDQRTDLLLLAKNRRGYSRLCEWITRGKTGAAKGDFLLSLRSLRDPEPDLLCIWGLDETIDEATASLDIKHLREIFNGHLYLACRRNETEIDQRRQRQCEILARTYDIPIVAVSEVLYHDRYRRRLQDIVTAIHHGTSVQAAGNLLKPNDRYHLRSAESFMELFADHPEWIRNTQRIADHCCFNLDELRYRYPLEHLPNGKNARQWLKELAERGLERRLDAALPSTKRNRIVRQMHTELALLAELEYEGYCLTMYELVQYCRRNDILCQGRGSAANSVVCFALGITNVDPAEVDILFERFLSRERAEPPDIDLDIEHQRREEVIQHVYEKYGHSHAAMVANVVRFRLKSAIREVGKALGISATIVDRVAKSLSHHDRWTVEQLRDAGLPPHGKATELLHNLVRDIQGFPQHLSIHPGGFILGDQPIATLVPVEPATMPNRTVVQWDKDDAEAVGLFKVDLLGLGALTHLQYCFDLLKRHYLNAPALSLLTIPRDDPATFAMISKADSIGVFQIESRAQMAVAPRLQPKTYYDLVIQISLIRPGPITGGMVNPYLRRRSGEEAVVYPHSSLEPVLRKTLGVPLFQEQVIRLAMVAADYSGGEADQLRRDMAAWQKHGNLERHRDKLIGRMVANGIHEAFAARVFEQIRGFGEYGFPESHAASFAHIAYATAYLRCHYLPAFTCALLNAFPMGFYQPATIIEDAKRHGLEVRPVDICHSNWHCTLEPSRDHYGFALRMGFKFSNGLTQDDIQAIRQALADKPDPDLDTLLRSNVHLTKKKWRHLAQTGALTSLGLSRRQALWRIQALPVYKQPTLPLISREPSPEFTALSRTEHIAWDYEASNHSTRGHPLEPHRSLLKQKGLPTAQELRRGKHNTQVRYVGQALARQRPKTANGVVFFTLDDETGFVNLIIWPQVFQKYSPILKRHACLGIDGKLQIADGVHHLIVKRAWVPDFLQLKAQTHCRDFH